MIKPLDNSILADSLAYARIRLENAYFGINFRDYKKGYLTGYNSIGIFLTRKEWSELADKPLTFYLFETNNTELQIEILEEGKEYVIPNIQVETNKKTIMTGALEKSSGFSISIDEAWNGTINIDM